MTLLGPCPCHGCGRPVTVVRRPVVIHGHEMSCRCRHGAPGCVASESTQLREVVAVDASGNHVCRRA